MYNMDTEQGQMMAFLWEMLEEGEYSDAATLAKQMLLDDPNNKEAISVLAVVYERMADASRDGGDEENEKEFLRKSLSSYLKLLALDPDSVAEKIKADKIRRRLDGDPKELNEDFLKTKWGDIKDKLKVFYNEKLADYPVAKWLKVAIIVVPVLILAFVGIGLYAKYNREIQEIENTPPVTEFSQNSNLNPSYQDNIGTYQGPTDTIYIENDNAKAERAEKELEEQYSRQVAQTPPAETGVVHPTPNRRIAQGSSQQNNYSVYNQNQVPSQVPSQGVKPLKLPWTELELKQTEVTVSSSEKEKADQNLNNDTSDKSKTGQREVKTVTKTTSSVTMKRADSLLDKALKEQNSGNREEAVRAAKEAKSLYSEEIQSGSGSRRARANIETTDTIIGNN